VYQVRTYNRSGEWLVRVNWSLTFSPLGKESGASRVALSPIGDGSTAGAVDVDAQAPSSQPIVMTAQNGSI
jgi:hypothetical protein